MKQAVIEIEYGCVDDLLCEICLWYDADSGVAPLGYEYPRDAYLQDLQVNIQRIAKLEALQVAIQRAIHLGFLEEQDVDDFANWCEQQV